jgi:drug/metabolite transporter (DMT)-like permease
METLSRARETCYTRSNRDHLLLPSSARPAPRETRILRGILLITLACGFFVVMNTGAKTLSAHLPVVEIIWARSLVHLVFVFALFAPTSGGWRLFATRRPAVQVTRSLLLLASTSFFFTALSRVPLADATSISFTAPFVVAALAGRLLHERVGTGQWLTIAVGFLGALVIIRPGFGHTSPYALLVFGSAACYSLYQILTRYVAGVDRPETSVTYSALVGTVLLSAVVPFYWRAPVTVSHALVLVSLGLLGGLGHYCVARALLWGPASILSPFHYTQLILAALAGYIVFGDVPSVWTWVGAAIIIGSGLHIVWRETSR